jgi:hypothetical protein
VHAGARLCLLAVSLLGCTQPASSPAPVASAVPDAAGAPSAQLMANDPGTVFHLAPPSEQAAEPDAAPVHGGPIYDPDPEGRPTAILRDDAPNMRYAAIDPASCEGELQRRGVPFVRGEPTAGVLTPERLRGPMHGVMISTGAPRAVQEKSAMEIFDCRLLLALDDFAALASPRGVVQMLHISAYRPKNANGCTAKYPGKQHCAALAVDIARFKLADGTYWDVQKDFHGRIGIATCGPTAQPPAPTPVSTSLWSLVCDAAARGIFNVMLTPNYNAAHFNHIHVEITPDAEWMMIH